MKFWLVLTLLAFFRLQAAEAQEQTTASNTKVSVVRLTKDQLGALDVAIGEMRKMKISIRGQQARLTDRGKSIYVSFPDDPINMEVVGSEGGLTWEIRKRDFKVVRVIHDR